MTGGAQARTGTGFAPGLSIWLPIIAGLAALYVPTLRELFASLWRSGEQTHGPLVLGIACALLYRRWPAMPPAGEDARGAVAGWSVFGLGLVLYVVGRSQDIVALEIGSAIWLLASILLLVHGTAALRAQWFPLFFMMFMIPLPAPVVDAVTMPMKIAVSAVAEQILFWVGFPVARAGVILQIAQYRLLVADACAGLHTLFTLEALGLLYLNVVRCDSLLRNATLALCVVPIAFAANVVRVVVLTLVTYRYGDDAGQGFLHDFAGLVLFVTALLLVIVADAILRRVVPLRGFPRRDFRGAGA